MRPAAGDSFVLPSPGADPRVEHQPVVPHASHLLVGASDRPVVIPTPASASTPVGTGPVRIVVVDGVITEASAPSLDSEAVVGRPMISLVYPEDESALGALFAGSEHTIHTVRLRTPEGGMSCLELMAEMRDGYGVVLDGWDVTQHLRRQQSLQRLALHDPLTGLANRLLFAERVHDELRRRRRSGTGLALLYADLDGFKAINDSWGHRAGDLLLVALAARLRGCLRPGDIAARLGGDEFGVCCPDVSGEQAALAVAHRLVEAATAPLNLGGAVVRVSISVGVAMAEEDDMIDHGGRLLGRADLAMYTAKQGGRERVALAARPTGPTGPTGPS